MIEIWKAIPGFEGMYEASNKGAIRSLERVVSRINGGADVKIKGKVLTPSKLPKGYFFVCLYKDSKKKQFYVHRLVAITFLETSQKNHINHIDGIKENNSSINLEWVTPKENTAHAISIGKFALAHIGGRTLAINNPIRSKKLSANDVIEIRLACKRGENQSSIAAKYGVNQSTVSAIKRKAIWNEVPNIRSHAKADLHAA